MTKTKRPTTNEEIITENAMKLTRDWNSFKQTKLHLNYMLNEARLSARREVFKELDKIEQGTIMNDDNSDAESYCFDAHKFLALRASLTDGDKEG